LTLLIAVLVGQMYLLIRWALRLARYGAEIELYDNWTGPILNRSEPIDR